MRSFDTSVVRLLDPGLPPASEPDGGLTVALFAPETVEPNAVMAELLASGIVLFLRARADDLDLQALARGLRRFLSEPGNTETGVLWIDGAADRFERWRTTAIPLKAAGADGGLVVPRVTYIDVRNYALVIPAGSTVQVGSQAGGRIEATIRSMGPDRPAFTTGHGGHRLRMVEPDIGLGLVGERAGCVSLTMAIDREGRPNEAGDGPDWFGYPALAELDVGFRLFFPDPDEPPSRDRTALASHRYPLIDELSTNRLAFDHMPDRLWLDAVIDPLHPLAPERSHLVWRSAPDGPDGPVDLPSGYRTNMGYTVHLTAAAGEARLHFAERPRHLASDPDPDAPADGGTRSASRARSDSLGPADLYLTPAGTYGLSVPRYGGPVDAPEQVPGPRLVCGLSGLEYLEVEAGRTEMVMVPGLPAHLLRHRSASALLRDLPTIIEETTAELGDAIVLTPDTSDQDQPISTAQADAVIARLRGLHLRADFRPSVEQRADLDRVAVVDELIAWLTARVWEDGGLANDQASVLASVSPGATTSWVWVRNRDGDQDVATAGQAPLAYHAQPEPATLYQAGRANPSGPVDTELLDYLEVPAAWLPASLEPAELTALGSDINAGLANAGPPTFPLLPYGGTDRGSLSDLRRIEDQLLVPLRRDLVHRISAAAGHPSTDGPTGASGDRTGAIGPQGTTPQGLLATFSADRRDLAEVRLATDTAGGTVALRNLAHGSLLKAMFQTSKLFAVISDPSVVTGHLTGSPLGIASWQFELDPGSWPKHDTILLFKYQNRSLLDLVADPSTWFDAEAFNGDAATVERVANRLEATLRRAVDAMSSTDPKERRKFRTLARVATQPNWNGVLAFDVAVPLRGLPDALLALAGGIDPDRFFASFVGIETTPIEVAAPLGATGPGTEPGLVAGTSSMFGLIDYVDPAIPQAAESGYNFHVPSLSVVLANSQVVDFGAEVVLVADRLFGEPVTLADSPSGRNLLRLVGVAEQRDGVVSYSFGFQGANRFLLPGPAIDEVEVTRAQFVTDPIPPSIDGRTSVTGRFLLWTQVRFAYRPEFDILSFGPAPGLPSGQRGGSGSGSGSAAEAEPDALSVDNLQVTLNFEMPSEGAGPVTGKRLAFVADRLSLDLGRSGHRQHSLYEKFPLALKSFGPIDTTESAGADSGFLPVTTPEPAAELGDEAYGLIFDLNLGSVGALAGGVGLVVSVRVAWSPDGDGLSVGLKLPGSGGGAKALTIQGVVTIGFEEIRFIVHPLDPEARAGDGGERPVAYLLKLRELTIKVLVLTLPTGGSTEVLLFGDPRDDVERDQRLLGWFGSYDRRPTGDRDDEVVRP